MSEESLRKLLYSEAAGHYSEVVVSEALSSLEDSEEQVYLPKVFSLLRN